MQLRTSVKLTAGGLQIDSHLSDAHYPVVCKWQPMSAQRQGHAAASPPFLFVLEVGNHTMLSSCRAVCYLTASLE